MRRSSIPVIAALGWLLAHSAAAAEDARETAASSHRSVEILAEMDRAEDSRGWLAPHLQRIHINKRTGLAYTRPVPVGEHNLEFSVRGPALGRKKRVGLSFELRF